MFKKVNIVIVIWFLSIILFSGLVISNVDWHTYRPYIFVAFYAACSFIFYMLGLKFRIKPIIYLPEPIKSELVKQCSECGFFLPFNDGQVINHYCPAKKKNEHKD